LPYLRVLARLADEARLIAGDAQKPVTRVRRMGRASEETEQNDGSGESEEAQAKAGSRVHNEPGAAAGHLGRNEIECTGSRFTEAGS
jgi:hypothetical protein